VEAGDKESGLRLAELLAAFSLTSDLGLGQPMEHVLRSWLIAGRLGERQGAWCRGAGVAVLRDDAGPATLRVTMDSPVLEWTFTATSTPALSLLNTMSAAMPLATWRRRWRTGLGVTPYACPP